MELVECQTCGSHSFTNGKCDYCGNHYETETIFEEQKEQETTYTELRFQETKTCKLILKIMIYTLVSIVLFAITTVIAALIGVFATNVVKLVDTENGQQIKDTIIEEACVLLKKNQ